MKIKHKIFLGLCLTITFAISSCKKWIAVTPKTQIENSLFFADRQGFVDGLNGVYVKMLSTSLYGRELTFGMADVLGRVYSVSPYSGSASYNMLYNGSYLNQEAYSLITSSWNDMYNAIANLNNLIEHLETADRSIFRAGEYDIIKGEALGLRAFLHFDLVRLFTKSYRDGGVNSPGVPYVTRYTATVTPRLTVKVAMEMVIADLKAAESLLKNDFLVTGVANTTLSSDFDKRKEKFNYYAVKGTLARAYLWMRDEPNALKQAEDVIAVQAVKFPFITLNALTGNPPNRVFTSEQLFGMTAPLLKQNYANILDTSRFTSALTVDPYLRWVVYEDINTDYRNQYLMVPTGSGGVGYGKLIQPAASNRMPLIKVPEMYYIAAECLVSTNPGKAIEYLNKVRAARGLTNLSGSLSASAILDEIVKEYRKEMPCEGQIFYCYKRLNAADIPYTFGPFLGYVLPLPQQEIDFGN